MSGAIGHNRTVLLYEASMTPANSRAYDGVCRYAEQAGWIVQKQPYSLAAEKRTHGRTTKGLSIPEALELWHPDGIIDLRLLLQHTVVPAVAVHERTSTT